MRRSGLAVRMAHHRFVRQHDRFLFGFDLVALGLPYWWDPDYYYAYPAQAGSRLAASGGRP
jgi:hypothetical protein